MMKKKFKIAVAIFISGDFKKLKEKIKTAKLKGADVVELRADSYPEIRGNDLIKLKEISEKLEIPVIFTLRSREEGGRYSFSFKKKLSLVKRAIKLNFDYLDIELKFLEKLKESVPRLKGNSKTKIILSYHNLTRAETLEGLRTIKKRMLNLKPDVMKLAVFSRNEKTNQDILKIIKETKREGKNIIGITMGEKGRETRIKGALAGNYLTYCSLSKKEKTAPGQISLTKWKRKFKI